VAGHLDGPCGSTWVQKNTLYFMRVVSLQLTCNAWIYLTRFAAMTYVKSRWENAEGHYFSINCISDLSKHPCINTSGIIELHTTSTSPIDRIVPGYRLSQTQAMVSPRINDGSHLKLSSTHSPPAPIVAFAEPGVACLQTPSSQTPRLRRWARPLENAIFLPVLRLRQIHFMSVGLCMAGVASLYRWRKNGRGQPLLLSRTSVHSVLYYVVCPLSQNNQYMQLSKAPSFFTYKRSN
jgi:hypothetical protein